jgi:hypothetical protein
VGHAREHPESGWILVTQSLSHGIAVANSKLDNAGHNHGTSRIIGAAPRPNPWHPIIAVSAHHSSMIIALL